MYIVLYSVTMLMIGPSTFLEDEDENDKFSHDLAHIILFTLISGSIKEREKKTGIKLSKTFQAIFFPLIQ